YVIESRGLTEIELS
ncbi:hypothetical protein JL09_g6958, partial [Pichia kudriavzevii]